jgi:hypothetical protein
MLNTGALQALQRSDSSYLLTNKPVRSESTVIYNTPQHCKSSYVMPSPATNRSKPVPQGASPIATGHLIEDIAMDGSSLNPQELLTKLRGKLGVSATARVESMPGLSGFSGGGGQNKGIWMLNDSTSTLVCKLVTGSRKHPSIPCEAESLAKLASEYPGIRSDPSLTFPVKVFGLTDPRSGMRFHLLVMRKAPGKPLADALSMMVSYNQVPRLLQILESLGRFIAGVHTRYNCQHNDFQPSNIFFDENTSQFTLIDVGGMGSSTQFKSSEGDVEHFCESLRIMGAGTGSNVVATEGKSHFLKGYNACRR